MALDHPLAGSDTAEVSAPRDSTGSPPSALRERLIPQSEAESTLLGLWVPEPASGAAAIRERTQPICIIGTGGLTATDDDRTKISADFLKKAVLTAKDLPGFELHGAVITGKLDFASHRLAKPLRFLNCRFDTEPTFNRAEVVELTFQGCDLPGFNGYRMRASDHVNLKGCRIAGHCNLGYAQLEAGLSLAESHFGLAERALSLQGTKIALGLLAPNIVTEGKCDLTCTEIAGQLDVRCAQFKGVDEALTLQQARIGEALFWRGVSAPTGSVNFTRAEVDLLTDDAESWENCSGGFSLDGFRYAHIRGPDLGEITARINWLTKGTTGGGSFSSQPWRQFAHVLRENGDDSAARRVMMERERLYIAHERRRMWTRLCEDWTGKTGENRSLATACLGKCRAAWSLIPYRLHIIWSCLKRLVIGYGYDPKRPLYWSLALILVGSVLASLGWQQGAITPASDQILTSGDWLAAMALDPVSPTRHWLSSASAQHYEEFSPFLFALDTYLPVMDLGQEKAWAVTTVTTTGTIGRALWVGLQAAGWIVTSLGIAAVAGLVQKGRND